jgi:hypothetical protein
MLSVGMLNGVILSAVATKSYRATELGVKKNKKSEKK